MFKSKLISNIKYYKFRSKLFLLSILMPIIIGPLFGNSSLPIWVYIIGVAIYGALLYLALKYQKKIIAMLESKKIEIDEKEIRIITRKSNEKEIIALDSIDSIELNKSYSIPHAGTAEITAEIMGTPKESFLILNKGNDSRRLDFVIDSYYMVNKLKNVIASWKAAGYNVQSA